jgi:long-chain acyl-CoA synthetase
MRNKIKSSNDLYNVREINDLKDMLYQSVELFASRNAFILKDSKGKYRGITYTRFKNDVDALGTSFIDLGLKDNAIAVIGENRYEWCVTYLSTVNGTGVIVPLDRELPQEDLEYTLRKSNAAAVVFSGKYLKVMETVSQNNPSIKYFINMDGKTNEGKFLSMETLLEQGRALIRDNNRDFIDAPVDNKKMSILLFTSGTTGFAKGVMLSHRNICSNIMSVRKTVNVVCEDSSLSILPLHHTYECTIGFLCLIYSGGTIAFCENLRRLPNNLKEYKPTLMITVPLLLENVYKKVWDKVGKKPGGRFMLKVAIQYALFVKKVFGIDIRRKIFKSIYENLGGRIRLIITGAAAIDPVVSKFFRNIGISVLQGYGLTECSPLVAGNRDNAFKDDSVGLPIPGVEVRIINADKSGAGEIITRGDNVMLGYFEDEEATRKSIVDGWFHTGDLGRIDDDGFVHILGRIKNVIVTKNGKNIYPEELEASINRNPFVKESLVLGMVDGESGETQVHAQILPNIGAIKEKLKVINISKDELTKILGDVIKNVIKNLPLYKHIKKFSIRDNEFIKTTTKKIKRHLEKKSKDKNNQGENKAENKMQ